MAIQDDKKIILTDASEQAKQNKPHKSTKEAAQDMFGTMPEVIHEAVRQAKDKHKRDFFIEILLRSEKVLDNVLHPYVNVTVSFPNPRFLIRP